MMIIHFIYLVILYASLTCMLLLSTSFMYSNTGYLSYACTNGENLFWMLQTLKTSHIADAETPFLYDFQNNKVLLEYTINSHFLS